MHYNISDEQIHRDNLRNRHKFLSSIRTREEEAKIQMDKAESLNNPLLTAVTALSYAEIKLNRVEAELALAQYELSYSQKEHNITKAKLLLAEEKLAQSEGILPPQGTSPL